MSSGSKSGEEVLPDHFTMVSYRDDFTHKKSVNTSKTALKTPTRTSEMLSPSKKQYRPLSELDKVNSVSSSKNDKHS